MDTDEPKLIYVVDDDPAIRALLDDTLSNQGYLVQQFVSGADFLKNCDPHSASCTLLDLLMPGMNGLELQDEIAKRNLPTTTVILTGHADVTLAVRAIKAGAMDVLEKPFCINRLLSLMPIALEHATNQLRALKERRRVERLFSLLTQRECDVAQFVIAGYGNKAIAEKMRLSPRTIEFHRARLMNKLQISTVAALVKAAALANGIIS
jgi:FixJ family two-component response regulator